MSNEGEEGGEKCKGKRMRKEEEKGGKEQELPGGIDHVCGRICITFRRKKITNYDSVKTTSGRCYFIAPADCADAGRR